MDWQLYAAVPNLWHRHTFACLPHGSSVCDEMKLAFAILLVILAAVSIAPGNFGATDDNLHTDPQACSLSKLPSDDVHF